jgi:hypothetical protein
MKQPRTYVKRRLQTFRFAGRPARGLYWKKDVYREWFEWARLANNYPKDWGPLNEFEDFEDWWKHPQYGFELFCEPPEQPAIEVLQPGATVGDNLVISVNKSADPEKALLMIRNLIKKTIRPKATGQVSQARYSPSKHGKYIKLNVLRRYRLAYTLKAIEGKTRNELAPELMTLRKSKQLPSLRVITRDITAAKAILKNVAKGIFPGDV